MDSSDFVSRFLHLGRAASVLSKSEGDELLAMLALVQEEMEGNVTTLVKESGPQPILCTYSSDVTPAKVAYHHVDKNQSLSGSGAVHRIGYGLEEFLLQRSFFKSIDPAGKGRVVGWHSAPHILKSPWSLTCTPSCSSPSSFGFGLLLI